MSRARPALVAIILAACTGDPVVVVASVTGSTEHSFFQGELRRRVTVDARRHSDGRVDGSVEVALHGAARHAADRAVGEPIRYQVTCLAFDGSRAWVGGRIVGPKDDPYSGGEDVWYVEQGRAGAPDRATVWIGRAASRCAERSSAAGSPSERGALAVRTLFPGA